MSNDFGVVDILISMLIGVVIGVLIGSFLAYKTDIDFNKFCPECGHRYKTEVKYCVYDGSELKMIGGEEE